MNKKYLYLGLILLISVMASSIALADHEKPCRYGKDCYQLEPADPKQQAVGGCTAPCANCNCKGPIESNHKKIRKHMTDEFMRHRDWMVEIFFQEHILVAMGMMASQLSTVAMDQVQMIGRFFDAKHQMETQRLFQKLMAEAHKDYQPSEGMCEFGTNVRSLATSSRKTDAGHLAFTDRVMKRQLRNGESVAAAEENSDLYSRIKMFAQYHCNKRDNANGLTELCSTGSGDVKRMNKDVDFTRTLESNLTLDIDFTKEEAAKNTPDEEDLFALSANLFAHKIYQNMPKLILATPQGQPREAARDYMNLRSVGAKRSVAQNSFSAIASERAKGDKEVAKYLKKIVTELGIKPEEVEKILGKEPSYFAQMEVLTKDIYQNPTFYTELYDKPANVLRKSATIRAINLMQDRDLLKSQLRTEAVLAVLLETMLHSEHERVSSILAKMTPKEKEKDE